MNGKDIVTLIDDLHDRQSFQELNWEGSFVDYLDMVQKNPRVARSAFQRIYDMIISHGKEEYSDVKKKIIRYHFFKDEKLGGIDAVYGLDISLMKLVNFFRRHTVTGPKRGSSCCTAPWAARRAP